MTGVQTYLSKFRHDSIGADFQSAVKLANHIRAAPPESRLRLFRNIVDVLTHFMIFPIFVVELLNYNDLKYC